MRLLSAVLLGINLVVVAGSSLAGEFLVGIASVIDGDTLEIRGQRIRLHGVDAPESGQSCEYQDARYRCGQMAANALAEFVGRKTVSCEEKDRDRYGRSVALCRIGDKDLNAWLVRQGHAVAYRQFSQDYVAQEAQARAERLGIWAGPFQMPWDWRRNRRLANENVSPRGSDRQQATTGSVCPIKGNINSKGERIYHVPGALFYERTRIEPSSGERWFCTEAEARAAGWRPSSQ